MHTDLPDQVFAIAGGRWDLHRCRVCRAGFIDPRPAPHALDRAYADGYYTHGDLPPSPDLLDGLRGLRLASRNAYINCRYGYDLAPSSRLGLLLAYVRPRSRAADDRAFRHLRRPRVGARLLDVGCGSGGFVARAQALGWEATGIDTDDAAISAGRASGLAVSTTPLEELAGSMHGAFDAVTMSHVIEHVADPVALLRAARAVMCSSGTLWIVTPNLNSRGHRRFGDRWMHLDPPRHLVLFGAEALDRALADAGFEVLDTPTSASGTIASFIQSWRIERGRSPLDESPVPPLVKLQGQVAGVRSLFNSSKAEELIRLARPSGEP
jgi:2-polyprenyl-3-methyl-5-hydroxy-6-metoxy-1,4-benzoquinol methylase